jgi:DeoR/GlpR family transcriptional regulator of sugar metabolism
MEGLERHSLILRELRARGRVTVPELAELTGCSDMTVRRDLDALAHDGLLRRVRGAAVSALTGEETPYPIRRRAAVEAKRHIAMAAADLLDDGETVVIDGGTTALEVARQLTGRRLTVLPLSLHTASALAEAPDIRLVMPGGDVRPIELALVGPITESTVDMMRFDTAVIGCCGLSARDGLTGHDLAEAAVKRAAIRAAARVIVVADGSKLGATTFGRVCEADQISILVTDDQAPEAELRQFRDAGVQVVLVPGRPAATAASSPPSSGASGASPSAASGASPSAALALGGPTA